ncbi:MAG: hypothetical protein ABR501_01385 [Pyrinomonadaceae bacterium]
MEVPDNPTRRAPRRFLYVPERHLPSAFMELLDSFYLFLGTPDFNPAGETRKFYDILGRFIVISFLALLVYFPARIFYLAEDKNRKMALLTMLLANLPLIVRALVASPR